MASLKILLTVFGHSADPLGLLSYCQPDQEITQSDIREFIAAKISQEIDALSPSLKIRATNVYVNSELNKQKLVNKPPPMLEIRGIITPQAATTLTPQELEIIFETHKEAQCKSNYLDVADDYNTMIMQTIIQRHKSIDIINDILCLNYKIVSNSSYYLDKNGTIDISLTLLKHLAKVAELFSLTNTSFDTIIIFKRSLKYGYKLLCSSA